MVSGLAWRVSGESELTLESRELRIPNRETRIPMAGDQIKPNESGTAVITAFLWDGRRVLLALRSEQVSTFPLHWAGISGYLEGDDPAAWALVEIEEELGLSREHVTLRRIGHPLEAAGASAGRVFVVHPFLFSVEEGAAVRGDWEAKRLEWVAVEELQQRSRRPAVPRLYDAFDRVWPPWPTEESLQANLQLAVRWLTADRRMGAGTLARCAGAELAKLARLCRDEEFDEYRGRLQEAIETLRVVRPSMTPPANLMQDLRDALDEAADRKRFLESAERLIAKSQRAEEELVRKIAEGIAAGTHVMTISYSSTVARALRAASSRLERVFICEGRPLCEGRQLAAELDEAGIAVTVLTDAQMHLLMPKVDLVLLGADAVMPKRGVVNKVGSALLALTARQFDKPVIVAAESLKRVRGDQNETPPFESGARKEVWPDAPDGIGISNVYFELVPWESIAQCIDEEGDFT